MSNLKCCVEKGESMQVMPALDGGSPLVQEPIMLVQELESDEVQVYTS